MRLQVNGREHNLDLDPERTLLSVLREELDLIGTKYGCGEGQCGACTVLINGSATRSCMTAIRSASGKQVTTIEGIAGNHGLHPLQKTLIEQDAMQCGYCTPGMVMSGISLLAKNPNPSDADIRRGMEGNVCRCGTYPRIVAAVRMASKAMKGGRRG